jgi:hypothetical protein
MSLLSPKHLVGPFTNPLHFFTILLVVVLMAVYRLSAGRIGLESAPSAVQPSGNVQVAPPSNPGNPIRSSRPPAVVNPRVDLLDAPTKSDAGTPKPANPSQGVSLDDIERDLGLTK